VPGVLNVQNPDQPGPWGPPGSGGFGPSGSPAVWVQEVGFGVVVSPKSMLWKLLPLGYENVTRPPAVIVTDASPVAGFSNA
jgi:hypothetical protein